MGIAQLLFGEGNYIGEIELDVIVSESATATTRVTKNPVEFGADIHDHIIVDPMTYTLDGVVSNIYSNVLDALTTLPSTFSNKTKAQIAWEKLLQLRADRQTFSLVQGLRTYENVILTNISTANDADQANGLFFTATMQEVNYQPVITALAAYIDSQIEDGMTPTISGGLKQL
jgi:hypothetical protein